MRKNILASIIIVLTILAPTSMTVFAAEIQEEIPTPPIVEQLSDETEEQQTRTEVGNKRNQNLTNEAREQRLAAKIEKLAKLLAEREARVAAKELRVAEAERQAVRGTKGAATEKLQVEH